MEHLGDELRAELQRLGGESGAGGSAVEAWPSAVGEVIARNAWPARTRADGTLVVHVSDAIWGFELTQQAAEISARLPGRPKLRFEVGPLPDEAPAEAKSSPPPPTPEDAREADEIAAGIVDRELRESVAKVIKVALARAPHDRSV